jgi:hypothetical protein
MKVLVNSDNQIKVDEEIIKLAQAEVDRALSRFEVRLTRVELYLSDLNGPKEGSHLQDKRCIVEARPAGSQPVSTTADETTVAEAIAQAVNKMKRLLETSAGREGNASRESIRHPAEP